MVKVVTDSCSDLPSQIAQDLGIAVVPLNVSFGEESFQDGVSITADEFYDRLIKGPILPKTAVPGPGAFAEVYSKLAAETDEITSIHISKKLSGASDSASLGREQVKQTCRIEVIDSLMASMGVGLLVITAAKAAQTGANLDQITTLVRDAMSRTRYLGLLDSLEYLQKGGRLGKGQALLGSVLNVKPILHIQDGEVCPLERARGRSKGLTRFCELVEEFPGIEDMAVMYTTTPDEADDLISRLSPLVPEGHMHKARVGPTIGTYLGPGALTVALIHGKA